MKTNIKTVHEEEYSDKSRVIGVLLNYNEEINFKESFIYVYKEGMYLFFNTIIDTIDYLLYGEHKMKRAYMKESDFDELFDSEFIEGNFNDKLKWV